MFIVPYKKLHACFCLNLLKCIVYLLHIHVIIIIIFFIYYFEPETIMFVILPMLLRTYSPGGLFYALATILQSLIIL